MEIPSKSEIIGRSDKDGKTSDHEEPTQFAWLSKLSWKQEPPSPWILRFSFYKYNNKHAHFKKMKNIKVTYLYEDMVSCPG